MIKKLLLLLICCSLLTIIGCDKKKNEEVKNMVKNPLLVKFDTPFEVPPFDGIKPEHYKPAFEQGMAKQKIEIANIVKNTEKPDFNNTLVVYVNSGKLLDQVKAIFFSETEANMTDALQKIESEIRPILSAHQDEILLDEGLFKKIKSVYEGRKDLNLNLEQSYILENVYRQFVRNGANLSVEDKKKLTEINKKLSVHESKFGENLLAENRAFKLIIEKKEDLAGLPESVVSAAAREAKTIGMEGKWVFTTDKPSMLPFLTYSTQRNLREKIYNAYTHRGDRGNEHDNKKLFSQIVNLRIEKAKLLGYKNYADYVLEVRMAKNSKGVLGLLNRLWKPALQVSKNEVEQMQAIIDREGGKFKLASWDWWFYAEKLRKEKYDLDDSELRPYFKLDNVIAGSFWVANQLYGLTFHPLKEIPKPHKEAMAYEVKEADGSHAGVLYLDYHPRKGKQVGAWCGAYRERSRRTGQQIYPVVTIVCNFTRPTENKPALLSLDEVLTLFHEFGHALDGLVADNTYATTFVATDFVELPAQIMEHWALESQVLQQYAKHYENGKAIPQQLVDKIKKSKLFNQGFQNVEYLAACLLDMAYHSLSKEQEIDIIAFENDYFKKIGLIPEIISRYRSTYFAHIAHWGYSAGYYSYIWSGVLDNDAFEAFKETSLFDQKTAKAFRTFVLEKNGIGDPAELYREFRGRDPKIDALLKNTGLTGD
jgi:peptidyl-dipeptidase Dcp